MYKHANAKQWFHMRPWLKYGLTDRKHIQLFTTCKFYVLVLYNNECTSVLPQALWWHPSHCSRERFMNASTWWSIGKQITLGAAPATYPSYSQWRRLMFKHYATLPAQQGIWDFWLPLYSCYPQHLLCFYNIKAYCVCCFTLSHIGCVTLLL